VSHLGGKKQAKDIGGMLAKYQISSCLAKLFQAVISYFPIICANVI